MKRIIIDTNSYAVVYNDLDHLAGTWSAEESDDFLRATAVFEKVDEDMWK